MTSGNLLDASLLALALCLGPVAAQATAQPADGAHQQVDTALEAEWARIAGNLDGVVGVAATDLSSGTQFGLNADQPFPMASTFKIAVAGAILHRVERGELSLEQMIPVDPDMYVRSEIIAMRLIHPGVSLSVANLVELMLTESDNTATDVLTELAGGPEAVTGWLRSIGITDQRVDRDTRGILRDFFHLADDLPFGEAAAQALAEDPDHFSTSRTPQEAFYSDPQDTTTPAAMIRLLTLIARGEALGTEETDFLLGVMSRCRTGEARLRGLLPEDVEIAHKTGTIGGSVNDVGIITLPDGRQLAIAVFIKASAAPTSVRERTIAEIARLSYDHVLTAREQQ